MLAEHIRLADKLDAHPFSTDEDREEAAYLRTSYLDDCRPGGSIGPRGANSYLQCVLVRLRLATWMADKRESAAS